MENLICGIDEVGRGSLAGSLFVCGVLGGDKLHKIDSLKDSKKLSKAKREEIYRKALELNISYFVVKCNSYSVDYYGISKCMKYALNKICLNLQAKHYILDGNTNFGLKNITCIIKGDSKIPQISLSSVIAKYFKDRECEALHRLYPKYNLIKNQGYGTKEHIDAIKLYGPSPIHRKSFKLKS